MAQEVQVTDSVVNAKPGQRLTDSLKLQDRSGQEARDFPLFKYR